MATTLKGMAYLRAKLQRKQVRAHIRYLFYDMKILARDLNISTPPGLTHFMPVLGSLSASGGMTRLTSPASMPPITPMSSMTRR